MSISGRLTLGSIAVASRWALALGMAACGGAQFLAIDDGGASGAGGQGLGGAAPDGGSDVSTASGGAGGSQSAGGSTSTGGDAGSGGASGSGGAGAGGASGKGGSAGSIVTDAGRDGTGGLGGSSGAAGKGSAGGVSGAAGSGGVTVVDAGPPACNTALSRTGCVECCNDRNTDGIKAFQQYLYGCACSDCYTQCSVTLCDTNTSRPSADCLLCLHDAGPTLGCKDRNSGCLMDAKCPAYLACVESCF